MLLCQTIPASRVPHFSDFYLNVASPYNNKSNFSHGEYVNHKKPQDRKLTYIY